MCVSPSESNVWRPCLKHYKPHISCIAALFECLVNSVKAFIISETPEFLGTREAARNEETAPQCLRVSLNLGGVPYFGVLRTRILLFRVPLFSEELELQ